MRTAASTARLRRPPVVQARHTLRVHTANTLADVVSHRVAPAVADVSSGAPLEDMRWPHGAGARSCNGLACPRPGAAAARSPRGLLSANMRARGRAREHVDHGRRADEGGREGGERGR